MALVLLTVGLLGIAGSSALAWRAATSASRERQALDRARSRLAALSAAPCGAASAGSLRAAPDLEEDWAVGAPLAGFAMVDVSVAWRAADRRRSVTLASAVLC